MISVSQKIILIISTFYLLILSMNVYSEPDYAREKRWANEVIPGLIEGEPVYLTQKNSHRFLGILTQVESSKTGIIVVHGMGLHPDWGFIGTLRLSLFDFAYTTLSIQMPILASNASYKLYPALFPEAEQRLEIAVEYLKNKGYQKIIVVSHSNGSRMSRVYMSKNPVSVNAWVALSLTQGDTYEGISVPVLDLYGDNDLTHVLESSQQRKESLQHNSLSKQKIIVNANHFFSGQEDIMIQTVKEFIDVIVEQKTSQ